MISVLNNAEELRQALEEYGLTLDEHRSVDYRYYMGYSRTHVLAFSDPGMATDNCVDPWRDGLVFCRRDAFNNWKSKYLKVKYPIWGFELEDVMKEVL